MKKLLTPITALVVIIGIGLVVWGFMGAPVELGSGYANYMLKSNDGGKYLLAGAVTLVCTFLVLVTSKVRTGK